MMRPIEWLLFLSFIPCLILWFSPTFRQRYRIALLPILIAGIHLLIEGWRIQMIPLYLLALFLPITHIPQWRKCGKGRGNLLLAFFCALILMGGGVLAGWLLPIVTLPSPTGPYEVGIVDRVLTDTTRERRLMVSVWYPALEHTIPAPLTHYPNEIMTGLGTVMGLPPLAFQHLRYFSMNASEGVPIRTEARPFPILVFSHGMVGVRLQNSSMLQELASWGYVVVAIDHTDAAAITVFPDGEVRPYDLGKLGVPANAEIDTAAMNTYVFPVWVADQRFVYDMLDAWAVNDPLLAGSLDLTRIGSFGHSFGGATSIEVCRIEPRCRASVNLDGGLYGESDTLPSVHPLLLMSSADSRTYSETVAEWTQMMRHATNSAYWLELPGSDHLSFTISPLLSPLLSPQGYDARGGLRTVDKYLRLFFDTHLSDTDTPPPMRIESDVRQIFP